MEELARAIIIKILATKEPVCHLNIKDPEGRIEKPFRVCWILVKSKTTSRPHGLSCLHHQELPEG